MKRSLIILLLGAVCAASFAQNTKSSSSKITEIRFGTSFGKCSGYCIQEVVFKKGMVEKTIIPHHTKKLETKKCSSDYDGFAELISKINLESFSKLEVTIGCPDCADAGAEWVQIFTTDGLHKKVTYDYGKEPKEITKYINELRKYHDQLAECD